jgi:tRNA (cytidine/uridine-2'-O-)-methyltransferase
LKYEPNLHIVLFQPEIPQNTGAIGRTCVAIGAKLWLVRPLGFQLTEKALRRAGLDYWQHLEWEIADSWEDLTSKLETRFWYFSKSATYCLYDAELEKGDAFVFGRESAGLPLDLLDASDPNALQIPIRSEVRSLNLSCSVAVAGYELVRQMNFRP